MRDSDKGAFGQMWADCWALYSKSVTPGIIELTFQALKRFELSDIGEGLTRHVNDPDQGQFAPKPADVVRNIEGAKGSRAMMAWSKVEKAIRTVGTYESVVFDDRIIHAVISDMGGWIELNKVTEDELPFKAREFEKRYQGYALRPPESFPKALIGISEAENSRNGKKVAPPVLVGDKDRAALVYQKGSDGGNSGITRLTGPMSNVIAFLSDNRGQESA